MNIVGRVVQSLKGFYNGINPATLTGAIDVVIVKQEDGTYLCSPFHVRFGKLGVLHSREKVVDIVINGEATDLQMKLGEAGEAFFVQEIESEEEDVLSYLATSPLPSSLEIMEKGVKELHQQVIIEEENQRSQPHMTKMKDPRSDSSQEDPSAGKPRRKVYKKRKQKTVGSKLNARSVSMPDSMGGEEAMFSMEVTNSSEDDEVSKHMYKAPSNSSPQIKDMDLVQGTTSHRRMSSLGGGSFVTPFSDPETSPIGSPVVSRPVTPKSDTEVDKQHTEDSQNSILMETSATWHWGEFPQQIEPVKGSKTIGSPISLKENDGKDQTGVTSSIWNKPKPMKGKDVMDGIYLDDLTNLDDPEMARIYLGRPIETEEDNESGRGPSLPQSPNSVEGSIGGPVSFTPSEVRHLGPVSLSLCGGLNDPEGISLDRFMQKVVTFEDLAEYPNITMNPDLVVKIHDKYFNWTTAGPMVLSQIVFQKQLPEDAVNELVKDHMPKKEKKKKKSSWFSWGRSAVRETSGALEVPENSTPGATESAISTAETTGISASSSTSTLTESNIILESSASDSIKTDSQVEDTAASSPLSSPSSSVVNSPKKNHEERGINRHQHQEENTSTETDTESSEKEIIKSSSMHALNINIEVPHDGPAVMQEHSLKPKKKKCMKSLRLTSAQINKMNLKQGFNEIIFSVTTQYQGTTKCVSHVYLWNYDDKIVISDIDGTITKSDALGHILPIIGRDWSQSGVAQLYTQINQNGYKLIYLSARAIGQSRSTKDMLKSIKQGELVLPDGPMFLNPTSLLSAFHREVIVKNPEEFKISCLKDIADLFPSSPFYAGFGNKFNDVIAYRALNIPGFRIFTINPQGQLRHDLSLTFISSYSGMSDIVDHFFPSLDQIDRGTNSQYNPVNYWRKPIPALSSTELEFISETSKENQEKDTK